MHMRAEKWAVFFILGFTPLLLFPRSSETYLDKTVSLQYRKAPLREVLVDLSKQTQVSFVYQDSLVDPVLVSCKIKDEPLESVLPSIVTRDKLDYCILDDCLIVLLPSRKVETIKPVERKIIKPKEHILNPKFKAPKVISKLKPEYPRMAVNRQISGRVSLNMLVNKNGTVDTVYVRKSSGYVSLDSTAIKHALQAQCSPARLGNRAISMWMKWDFDFQFKSQSTSRRTTTKN